MKQLLEQNKKKLYLSLCNMEKKEEKEKENSRQDYLRLELES